MTTQTPAIVTRLYRAVISLGPREYRERFAADQVRLFEEMWHEERPATVIARLHWTIALFWRAFTAAFGARRDKRRSTLSLEYRRGFIQSGWSPQMSDFRYVVRSLLRARWFAVGATLTFAVGIGINIAAFAFADRVLFRPLPFRDADRLVSMFPYTAKDGQRYSNMPKAIAVEARHHSDVFEDIAFVGIGDPYTVGPSQPTISLVTASGNVLNVLGVQVVAGRPFTQDDVAAKRPVVLLKYEVWRDRFGADRAVFGRTVCCSVMPQLARTPVEIVGVLPPEFVLPTVNWAGGGDGLVLEPTMLDSYTTIKELAPGVFARLRPAVTVERARDEIGAIIASLESDVPVEKRDQVAVQPLREGVFWRYHSALRLLFLGGALVWLIGAANLGTLMVARAHGRETDAAIRLSLGASRGRLLWTNVLEALVVCGAGTCVALVVLRWTLASLAAIIPGYFQSAILTNLDPRLVAFAIMAAVAGAVLASLSPAWWMLRVDPHEVLKRGSTSGRRTRNRGGRSLLVVETAIGTVLVVAAALAIRSLVGMLTTDLGYQPEGLYAADGVLLPRATPPTPDERFAMAQQNVEALRRHPSILAASAASGVPFGSNAPEPITDESGRRIPVRRVLDDYFTVMQTPLVAGRVFAHDEVIVGAPVVMMSVSAARQIWPGKSAQDAVGETARFQNEPPRQLVGVVADTHPWLGRPVTPEVFLPARAGSRLLPIFRARPGTTIDSSVLKPVFEAATGPVRTVAFQSAMSMQQPALQDPKLYADVFGLFAVVALLLAAIGLFAIANGDVARRTYETGVRLTLGATPAQVQRLMLRETIRPVAVGVAIGLFSAWWAARFMQALLHDVDARSPLTFVFVAAVLAATAILAGWLPARRAARTDPAIVLRAQ